MSRTKDFLLVGLAACSGALAIFAWRQHGELKRWAALVPAGTPAGHAGAVTPAVSRTYAVGPARAAAAAPGAGRSAGFGALAADREPAAEGRGRFSSRNGQALVRLMENPEFVQALARQRHASLDARFGELFRRLNLEGESLAAFKRLLADKENIALDVVAVSETAPEGPLAPETLRAGIRAAQSQVEAAIQQSLGDERYAQYLDYERTLAQRATVAQLQARLSYTGTPLTPAQAEAVVGILARHAPAAEAAPPPVSLLVRAGVPEAVPLLPTNAANGRVTEPAVVQAQAVLAPAQVEALREIQEEQQAAMKAAEMVRDAVPTYVETIGVRTFLLQ